MRVLRARSARDACYVVPRWSLKISGDQPLRADLSRVGRRGVAVGCLLGHAVARDAVHRECLRTGRRRYGMRRRLAKLSEGHPAVLLDVRPIALPDIGRCARGSGEPSKCHCACSGDCDSHLHRGVSCSLLAVARQERQMATGGQPQVRQSRPTEMTSWRTSRPGGPTKAGSRRVR